MRKILLSLALFISFSCSVLLAETLKRIELLDGSVLIGEISSIKDGTYTITSQGAGELKIKESNIKQISFAGNSPTLPPAEFQSEGFSEGSINAMANKIMSNKETLGMAMSLQNDPQFQEILNDPEIINAVKTGNSASLMSNDKFMQLQDNPTIRKIKEKTSN